MKKPLVTFGIVNCNRLFYLQSCLESLIECTFDFPDKEIIVIDAASVEEGTEEYLKELEARTAAGEVNIRVFRQDDQNPTNGFADCLNLIYNESNANIIVPLQGDMQFIVKGEWLHQYVDFLEANKEHVGCILLDAQRQVKNKAHVFKRANHVNDWSDLKFLYDLSRSPIATAGDVMYHKSMLSQFVPWKTGTGMSHEGGQSAEADMLDRVKVKVTAGAIIMAAVPQVPVSAAIYTDPQGTNARVRGNKRYGKYWPAKKDHKYYKVWDFASIFKELLWDWDVDEPLSLESGLIKAEGWNLPIDASGAWMKNPIKPELATEDQFEIIYSLEEVVEVKDEYMDDWLNG